MTQPLCSSATFDALVVIGLLTMLLLLAIAWIAQAYRRARLGGRLLAQFPNYLEAGEHVHGLELENARLDTIMVKAMTEIREDLH
jgi:hypothetical protein